MAVHDGAYGQWLPESELGRGSYGIVYRARHSVTGKEAALKVIRAGTRDPQALRRFEREVDLLGRLDHPGLVRVLDRGTRDDVPWVALELVQGSPLGEQTLPVRDHVALLACVARAVGEAHRSGVVHRDLKPANVLVGATTKLPTVVDFGLAFDANLEASRLSRTGEVAGTPAYMAPEVVRGESAPDDPRRDVYALGVMLYERLSGAHPFVVDAENLPDMVARILRGAPPLARTEEVDSELASICVRACALDLEVRTRDGDTLGRELEGWLARPLPAKAAPHRPALAWAAPLTLVGVVVVVAILLGGARGPVALAPAPAVVDSARPERPGTDPSGAAHAPEAEVGPVEALLLAHVEHPKEADESRARCSAVAARFPDDPRARFLGAVARAFDDGAEFEARRQMVRMLREARLPLPDLVVASAFFRTLGFDRAACCVGEDAFPEASRPRLLRFYELQYHLASEPPVCDPVRAERLARGLLAEKKDADAMDDTPRWLLHIALSSASLARNRLDLGASELALAVPEAPRELAAHLENERKAIKEGLVRPVTVGRHFVVRFRTTPFVHWVSYHEERTIETEPAHHPENLIDMADEAEAQGRPEHAAVARLKAARFFRETQRGALARTFLERSAAATLPLDTRALVQRALARALLFDEPVDAGRAEKLALEAALEAPGFDPRTPCERADAWALVARARLVRGDREGARSAIESARKLAPTDARELDELEAKLAK